MTKGEIEKIIATTISKLDRDIPASDLPNGCLHLHKEVFSYQGLVFKGTSHNRLGGKDKYLFINEGRWLEHLQQYSFSPEFWGCFRFENDVFVVTKQIPGVTLQNLSSTFFKNFEVLFPKLETELNAFLSTMEKEGLTHKDLEPQNIMINDDLSLFKVLDYQFCYYVEQDLPTENELQQGHYEAAIKSVGSKWRMPGIVRHSFASDRFAIKKILSEIEKANSSIVLKFMRSSFLSKFVR